MTSKVLDTKLTPGTAIVGLAALGLILYLYYLFCRWMVLVVAPELLVIGSLLATGALPVLYALAAVRVYDRPGWRRVFWVPVVVLLFFIWVDLALLVAFALVQLHLPAASLPVLVRLFAPIASGAPPNALVFHLAPYASPFVALILACLVVTGMLIAPLLIAVRGLSSTIKDAEQPAFRQYFFAQARVDLFATVQRIWPTMHRWIWTACREIWTLSAGWWAIFVWPLTLTAYLALLPLVAAAALSLATLVGAHFVGVHIAMLVNSILAFALNAMERAVIWARRGHAKCPHAGCHQPVPLPIFLCPSCEGTSSPARHDRLIPGPCGLLYRVCVCGARLPTLFLLGKGKLPAQCSYPSCRQRIPNQLFSASVHIPIYGAPSSGKTMFMMAATWQAMERQWPGVRAKFVNREDHVSYHNQWKFQFEGGTVRDKTTEKLPSAFTLALQRRGGFPLSLYLYDPAGEAMLDSEQMQGHRFLEYFDGLALLLDPLSLPTLARAHEERGAAIPASAASVQPRDLIEHVVNVLETQARLRRHQRYRRRIAVILTKADLPVVREQLGLTPPDGTPGERWGDAGMNQSELIRAWFRRNEPALFQVLEARFADLRFFATSALGHEPDGRPFTPRNILQPLSWLLSRRATLARPRFARFTGRLAEVSAALLVAVPLLVGSVAGSMALARWIGSLRDEAARPQSVADAAQPAKPVEPPPVRVEPGRATPKATVESYWTLVADRHLDESWPYLTDSFRRVHNEQGFDGYSNWWRSVCGVQASAMELTSDGALEAKVRYDLDIRSGRDCKSHKKSFEMIVVRDSANQPWQIKENNHLP